MNALLDTTARMPLWVSLTTLPSRMEHIRPTLQSLLQEQALCPDRVLLCLPRFSSREGCAYSRPSWLADFGERLTVVECEHDDGPGTKLLGCLPLLEHQPPLCLVVVDDDMRYRREFLETIYAAQVRDLGSSFSFYTYMSGPFIVGQGADGFSFNTENLQSLRNFADMALKNNQLRLVDDLWISAYLHGKDVRVRSLAHLLPPGETVYFVSHQINQLQNLSGNEGRENAMVAGVQYLLESGFYGSRVAVLAKLKRLARMIWQKI